MITSFILLSLAHLLPWIYLAGKAEVTPEKLMSLLSGVMIFPYFLSILFFSGDDALISDYNDTYWLIFSAYYSVGMVFLYFGGGVVRAVFFQNHIHVRRKNPVGSVKGIASFLLVLGVGLVYLRLELAGGVFNFLQDIANRSKNLSGGGLIDVVLVPSVFLAVLYYVYAYSQEQVSFRVFFLILFLLFVLMSLFGGRKAPMQIVVFALIYLGVLKKGRGIFSLKLIPVYIGLAIFFAVVLYFRLEAQGNVESFSVGSLIGNTSYVDIYVFITKHFSESGVWFGAAYGDLYYRIFGAEKVPIDDGVYIYNLYKGNDVYPPQSVDDLLLSSLPPESYGAGFMNFGFLGVCLYFFVRGVVVVGAFLWAVRKNMVPLYFYIYLFLLFNFHLSNLRITQLIMMLSGLFVILSFHRIWQVVFHGK